MIDLFSKHATSIYSSVWERIKKGEELSGDAELIAETMIMHPEFDPFWTAGETAFQPQEINGFVVNPLVHTGLHVTIEKQLDMDDPVEVRMALQGLIKSGVTRHEAIHQIAGVWGDLYFRSVRRGGPFEDWTYTQALMVMAGEPQE